MRFKLILLALCVLLSALAAAQSVPTGPNYFGIDYRSLGFPSSSHQIGRLWDCCTPSGTLNWATIQKCTNGTWTCTADQTTHDFTALDAELANMASHGVTQAMMALGRTPPFATSNIGNMNCAYAVPSGSGEVTVNAGGTSVSMYSGSAFRQTWTGLMINGVDYSATITGPNTATISPAAPTGTWTYSSIDKLAADQGGQCEPPTDLFADGTGSNLYFRRWVAAVSSHVNANGYSNTHARVLAWESWNEPDSTKYWAWNRTATMDQQIRLLEDARCIIKGDIPFVYATRDTCAQVQASVGLSGPTDPLAIVAMPSFHGPSDIIEFAQAFLYCTGARVGPDCHNGGHASTDIINFHFKPGNQGSPQETTLSDWVANVRAILEPAEQLKALWNTEGGYHATLEYWLNLDDGMKIGWLAANYVYSLSQGIASNVWYEYNSEQGWNGLGSVNTNKAYDTVYRWLVGSTVTGCTTSDPANAGPGKYTYWCSLVLSNGQQAQVVWDNSQTCSSGTCNTRNQAVNPIYITYSDLLTGAPTSISGGAVPVGFQPVLLQGSHVVAPPSGLTATVR